MSSGRDSLESFWLGVRGGVMCTPEKFTRAPERAFVLGHSTVWLHFCSLGPRSSSADCLLSASVAWVTFSAGFFC
jgi:hypothetical protein